MTHYDTILLRYARKSNEKFLEDGEHLRGHLSGELGCRDIGKICWDYIHTYIHLVDARKLENEVYFLIKPDNGKSSTKPRILHIGYSTLEQIAQRWGFKAEVFDSIPAIGAKQEEPRQKLQWG